MTDKLPEYIYILPLRYAPVFPGLLSTIEVTDPQDIKTINDSEKYNGFGLLLLKDSSKNSEEIQNQSDFYDVGTYVLVKNRVSTIFGSVSLFIESVCRFKVVQMLCTDGIFTAKVEFIDDEFQDAEKKRPYLNPKEAKAFLGALRTAISERDDRNSIIETVRFNASNVPEPIKLADYLASAVVPRESQQQFLQMLDPKQRIMTVLMLMKHDKEVKKLQNQILSKVNQRLDSRQREYFLREQLKAIREELSDITKNKSSSLSPEVQIGESVFAGEEDSSLTKLLKKIIALKLTGEAKEAVDSEINKLKSLDRGNPEFSMIRGYLETVASLPWNAFTPENFTISKAKKILDEDHYGIKDVKDRILEFLAVRKLKTDNKGSIICLVGPPGVGKTSVGVSIARALGKKYYRFSVGGMRDEAEIKGHRRTYIGSMPGQIIKGLKIVKTKNPVFVIDEIDKMTVSNQGDPSAALLEVLDPEQNSTFRDHYLDLPFDVSNVLFIVTANSVDSIPKPLLDRMECIELNGYTSDEKLCIGKKYLVPKSRTRAGLTGSDVRYSDKILRKIAEEYAREAGVRNFEKALDKIHRKLAMEIVGLRENHADGENLKLPVWIDDELLVKYLGQPIFHEDEILRANKPGMSIGLAWTSMGGDVLAIEAQHIPGKGELKLTGQLGDVMKESAALAFSYIKSISEKHGIPIDWYEKNSIHLHVPEGATPKDGPSAGITMATAMYSLITSRVMAPDMAMTGELTLLGKVMPIGGLKEKVLAARRNAIKTIIIPKFNERDLSKLEENVTEGITFHLVTDMEEVLALAFPEN